MVGFQSIAQNEVENDAELSSLKDYFYTCWSLDGFSLSDDSDHVIEGKQSFIVKASENQGRGDMKSPWIKLEDGKVELEVKPTSEIEKPPYMPFYCLMIRRIKKMEKVKITFI